MALDLAAVLAHPALEYSSPVLVAGDPAGRMVRWVHSSDIYEIAPLLRGGELLLTTGLGLKSSSPDERRAFVRALAERGVAGVALELTRTFAEVPAEMALEAERVGLPLVALRLVHPFVEVTEQINSAILDSSVERLRHCDDVGRALSRTLAQRSGVDALVLTLHELLGRSVLVTDAAGRVLAQAGDDPSAALASPEGSAAIVADGVLLGGLVIGPGGSSPPRLQAVLERAPEFLAIELLRSGSESLLFARERRDLLQDLLEARPGSAAALAAHASAARVRPESRWVGLAIAGTDGGPGLERVQSLARRARVLVLAAELDATTYALLAAPPAVSAADLFARLDTALDRSGPVVAVGPVVSVDAAGRSLRAARQTLAAVGPPPARGGCVRAEAMVVERLLTMVGDELLLDDLVEEQLGELIRSPRSGQLLRTLEAYLDTGCSKAQTARVLHLRRQSVHQRLSRVADRLGRDLDETDSQTALRLALAVLHRRRAHPDRPDSRTA